MNSKRRGEEGEEPEKTDSNSPLKVNSAAFSSLAYSKRTSTTWFYHFSQVPTLLAKAKRLLNNLPLKQMEEAQIVRYRTGEEISCHYDEISTAQVEKWWAAYCHPFNLSQHSREWSILVLS